MTTTWTPSQRSVTGLPLITLRGSAYERGVQYGQQAKDRIHRSRREYEQVYAHFATWDWERVRLEAEAFIDPISQFNERYLEEMRGIAAGSDLEFLDILAMNLRTEILFAAKARTAAATLPPVAECTSFSAMTKSGERIIGQNWDWLTFSADTVVLIEAFPDDGPAWMTVVEAGLLAKYGMNSAGLAIGTNALVSSRDVGAPGVPYHVMLRALLDSVSATDVAATLQRAERSSSANYMLATGDGLAVNAETRPGGYDQITWSEPDAADILIHANHFSESRDRSGSAVDVGLKVMPDTIFRLQRARMLAKSSSNSGSVDGWKAILSDHAGYPDALCCHPDPASHPVEQWKTVTGVIFEPSVGRVHLSIGNPCAGSWQTLEYGPGGP